MISCMHVPIERIDRVVEYHNGVNFDAKRAEQIQVRMMENRVVSATCVDGIQGDGLLARNGGQLISTIDALGQSRQ